MNRALLILVFLSACTYAHPANPPADTEPFWAEHQLERNHARYEALLERSFPAPAVVWVEGRCIDHPEFRDRCRSGVAFEEPWGLGCTIYILRRGTDGGDLAHEQLHCYLAEIGSDVDPGHKHWLWPDVDAWPWPGY